MRSHELPSAVTTSRVRQLPCRHGISAEYSVGKVECYCMDKKTKWEHSRDDNVAYSIKAEERNTDKTQF